MMPVSPRINKYVLNSSNYIYNYRTGMHDIYSDSLFTYALEKLHLVNISFYMGFTTITYEVDM